MWTNAGMLYFCYKCIWNPYTTDRIHESTWRICSKQQKDESQVAVVMISTVVSMEDFKKFPQLIKNKCDSYVETGDDMLCTDISHAKEQTAETVLDSLMHRGYVLFVLNV